MGGMLCFSRKRAHCQPHSSLAGPELRCKIQQLNTYILSVVLCSDTRSQLHLCSAMKI